MSSELDVGLWTKAVAVSDGNDAKAKSRYIEMRANAIRQERQASLARMEDDRRRERTVQDGIDREASRQVLRGELLRQHGVLAQEYWNKYKSPEAVRRKRWKNIYSTIMFSVALTVGYYVIPEGPYILFVFGSFGIWLFSLVTYGREALEEKRARIAAEIERLR